MQGARGAFLKVNVLGVLKEGVDPSQARAELNTIARRLADQYPETNDNLRSVELERFVEWFAGKSFQRLLYILLFCSFLVLGVACANVFNLVMTRISTRAGELSIRSAMGASRAHIISQVVLDGLILTFCGTAVGVLIAGWSLKAVAQMVTGVTSGQEFSTGSPNWWNFELDFSVFGFVIAVVFIAALASSLVPGLRAARSSVAENLKDDARTSSGLFIGALSKLILGFQVVVTGVLAFVSVLLLLVWLNLKSRELPYDPNSILNAGITLTANEASFSERNSVHTSLRERLVAHPGIDAVAFSFTQGGSSLPGSGWEFFRKRQFEVEGQIYEDVDTRPQASLEVVSEGFESVFNIEPLLGRSMSMMDKPDGEAVCVINKSMADAYWPNENPVGKRIKLFGVMASRDYRTIVGVLPNILPAPLPGEDLLDSGHFKVYLPYSQVFGFGEQYMIVRTKGNPHQFSEIIEQEISSVDPTRSVRGDFETLGEMYGRLLSMQRIVFIMFGVFGTASLVLGVTGLYSVMSFTTRQRFREFGIRMALGADTKEIMLSAAKRGLSLLATGGALGVALGHAVSGHIRTSMDVYQLPLGVTYPIVIGILILATAISMGLPAWRASRISPTQALRVE